MTIKAAAYYEAAAFLMPEFRGRFHKGIENLSMQWEFLPINLVYVSPC